MMSKTMETIKTYQGSDVGASQCLVTLENFIGDCDGAELEAGGALDGSDAVTAINGLIWSLEQRDAQIARLRAVLIDMIDLATTVSPYSLSTHAMQRVNAARSALADERLVSK
jgi:hypothetical protein